MWAKRIWYILVQPLNGVFVSCREKKNSDDVSKHLDSLNKCRSAISDILRQLNKVTLHASIFWLLGCCTTRVADQRSLFGDCGQRCQHLAQTYTYTHNRFLRPYWILSRITWVSRQQKGKTRNVKPMPFLPPNQQHQSNEGTYTYSGDQSSLICFLHLLQSMASFLFNLCDQNSNRME